MFMYILNVSLTYIGAIIINPILLMEKMKD